MICTTLFYKTHKDTGCQLKSCWHDRNSIELIRNSRSEVIKELNLTNLEDKKKAPFYSWYDAISDALVEEEFFKKIAQDRLKTDYKYSNKEAKKAEDSSPPPEQKSSSKKSTLDEKLTDTKEAEKAEAKEAKKVEKADEDKKTEKAEEAKKVEKADEDKKTEKDNKPEESNPRAVINQIMQALLRNYSTILNDRYMGTFSLYNRQKSRAKVLMLNRLASTAATLYSKNSSTNKDYQSLLRDLAALAAMGGKLGKLIHESLPSLAGNITSLPSGKNTLKKK